MVDIVYTLADKSNDDFQELKYSLRSLEKFGSGYSRVIVVGGKPTWLSNEVIHLEAHDKWYKQKNILEKLKVAASSDYVTDNFWHFNDDYFLLKPHNFKNYVSKTHELDLYYYVWGEGREHIRWNKYTRVVEHTHNILKSKNLTIKHHDVHFPFKFNKDKFIKMTETFSWDCPQSIGYIIRSVYGNFYNLESKEITNDAKLRNFATVEGSIRYLTNNDYEMFSSGEQDLHNLVRILEELYPQKSKYEI